MTIRGHFRYYVVVEHLSYAMRNLEATRSFIYFNSPAELLDWSHLVIELLFLIGLILTIFHVVRYTRQNGNLSALYTFAGAVLYGLVMDIISYYTVESFWHGEFSVMLLFNRLPLYIVFLYPTLIYHLFMTIRRYDFNPLVEAISVGFFGGLMYLIFDNMGPQLGWWIWDRSAASNLPFLSSVPLTSYGWFFLYTGAFAWLARRICWKWLEDGKRKLTIGIGVATLPITTILLGTLIFAPYSILARNVPPWSLMTYQPSLGLAAALHAAAFMAAGFVFIFKYKKPEADRDKLLMAFPLLYLFGLSYLYIAKYQLFLIGGPVAGNLVAGLLAIIACTAIVLSSHPVRD